MGGPGSGRKKGSGSKSKKARTSLDKELSARMGSKVRASDFGRAGRIAIANMKKK